MQDPYRDVPLACPVCPATMLREFQTRLCCDSCSGIQISEAELSRAIHDLTGFDPTYEYVDETAGERKCPRCSAAMTTCKLRVTVDDKVARPAPTLDRCVDHGLWFDGEELASVFAKVRSKVSPRGGGAGWPGGRRGIGWWRTGM